MKAKIVHRKPAVLMAEMIRRDKWRPPSRKRRYAALGNAIAGLAKWIVVDGYVGDKIVLYDIDTGLEVGVVKLDVLGRLSGNWIWEKEKWNK